MIFTAKFLFVFCLLYFGTIAWIGLSAPGGFYSPFIERYLDYVSWIKLSLLHGTKLILSVAGIETKIEPGFVIRIINHRGVVIAMDCVGYGVYSFWIAFAVSNNAGILRRTFWIIGGILLLWLINVIRISLFLVAINKGWAMPLGIDHHTWFNIFAYCAIFLMIFFVEKSLKNKALSTK